MMTRIGTARFQYSLMPMLVGVIPHACAALMFILLSHVILADKVIAAPADTVRFITAVELPTNFYLDGKFSGTTTELVKQLQEKLGWQRNVEVYPWARAYHIALRTPNVLVFTVGKSKERIEAGFQFIGPVSTRVHGVFTRASYDAAERAQVRSARMPIAAVRGDWRTLALKRQAFTVHEVTEHLQSFEMLMRGRVNYWVSSDLEAPVISKLKGMSPRETKLVWVIQEAPSYMAFSPGSDPALVAQWREAFKVLRQTNFFEKQAVFWSQFLNIQIDFSFDKGYFIVEPVHSRTPASFKRVIQFD